MRQTVSILGAGPAGLALAFDLQNRGIDVLIYSHPDHLQHVNSVREKGQLIARGLLQGTTHVHFTTEIELAIAFSSILILTVPSTGQETILEELRPFSLYQHTIIAIPGNLFSLVADIRIGCILETNLSPYSCRMQDGELLVLGKKEQIFIASSRRVLSASFRYTIESILPVVLNWRTSVIEVSLLNVNGIFHPLMMIMNAGWIESTDGDFCIYRDGLSPSVARAMAAIDEVRVKIGQGFGLDLLTALECSNECYGHNFTTLVDLAQNSKPHNRLKAPPNLGHRNISEDVPDLLVSWMSLADKLGVDASPIRAIIVLVQISTGIDYLDIGRNSKKLRLDSMSKEEVLRRFSAQSRNMSEEPTYFTLPRADGMIMSQL